MNDKILYSELLRRHGFVHGFSTRLGGVSHGPFASLNLADNVGDDAKHVAENRTRFAAALNLRVDEIMETEQVHGNRVYVVTNGDANPPANKREADALINRDDPRAIGIRTADCVPILLAHPASRSVAAVHAGWRGVVVGIVAEALRAWAAPADEIVAAIGPHIRSEHFEVGADVARQLAGAIRGVKVAMQIADRWHVDLSVAIRQQLLQSGLCAENIEDLGGDTFAESELFFSHRRDRGVTGRHLSVISPTKC